MSGFRQRRRINLRRIYRARARGRVYPHEKERRAYERSERARERRRARADEVTLEAFYESY